MDTKNGIIMKAIAGFYYVETGNQVFECKARGSFRKEGIKPLVGDNVAVSIDGQNKGIVEEILPRKNDFVRPPIANLDQLFLVASIADPAPNTFVLDKMLAICEEKNVEPIIIINKSDLASCDELKSIYETAGFRVIVFSTVSEKQIDSIKNLLDGKISAFSGNSGVGKSSILNLLAPELSLQTGITSAKLGRGKHTTRHIELYHVAGGYLADTPGFSSIDMERCDFIRKENMQFCFREFADYIDNCKFTGCSHTSEKGCAVIDAVGKGIIPKSRHESYIQLYKDSDIPDWQLNKRKN